MENPTTQIQTVAAEIETLARRMDPIDGIWVDDPRYPDTTCGLGVALRSVLDTLTVIKDDLTGQQ